MALVRSPRVSREQIQFSKLSTPAQAKSEENGCWRRADVTEVLNGGSEGSELH